MKISTCADALRFHGGAGLGAILSGARAGKRAHSGKGFGESYWGPFHELRPVFERKTSLSDLKESHQALKLNPAESRLLN